MSTEHIRLILNQLDESILTESKISQVLKNEVGGKLLLSHLLGTRISHDSEFEEADLSLIMKNKSRFSKEHFAIIIGEKGCAVKEDVSDYDHSAGSVDIFSPYRIGIHSVPGGFFQSCDTLSELKRYIGRIQTVYVATNLIHRQRRHPRRSIQDDEIRYIPTIISQIAPSLIPMEPQILSTIRDNMNDFITNGNYDKAEELARHAKGVQQMFIDLKNPTPGVTASIALKMSLHKMYRNQPDWRWGYGDDEFIQFLKKIINSVPARFELLKYVKNYLSGNM